MRIVWDERKRLANLDRHELDFATLNDTFFMNAAIRPAKLDRLQAIGQIDEQRVSVIFARLGSEALSVVSMRRANVEERRTLDG